MTRNKKIRIVIMKHVKNQKIEWLWRNWLAIGKLTIFSGEAGIGKTSISMDIASIVTRGGEFPDGSVCENSGSVLIFSTEDDISTTLNPRLTANKADPEKIFYIDGVKNSKGEKDYFDPSKDFPLIVEQLESQKDIRLIIIDPIVSVVDGDMHKANEVRKSLTPLVQIAEEYNCAVLGITHFAKGGMNNNLIDRIIGSQAFTAFSRMVWVVIKGNQDNILLKAKSNIASLTGGCAYQIKNIALNDGIETTITDWTEYFDQTSSEILKQINQNINDSEGNNDSAISKASNLILDYLKNFDEVSSDDLFQVVQKDDVSKATYIRAQQYLKKEKKIQCHKRAKNWTWSLIREKLEKVD